MNLVTRFVYVALLAVLLAFLVGVSIDAVYPGPEYPEVPMSLQKSTDNMSAEELEQQADYDRQQKDYMTTEQVYSGWVSLIALACGAILLVISTSVARGRVIMMDMFLFGGIFTIFYAAIRGFTGEPRWMRVVVIGVGLLMSWWAGQVRLATKLPTDNETLK